jgi:hypothetical protein
VISTPTGDSIPRDPDLADPDLTDPDISPLIPFADPFDLEMARSGPAAVFSLGPRGQLRLALNRSRDQGKRAPSERPRGFHHCVFQDRTTRHRQYVLCTSSALCIEHPRADITVYETQDAALDAVRRGAVAPNDSDSSGNINDPPGSDGGLSGLPGAR